MTIDPNLWATGLQTLHAQVWARLLRGVQDRHAPARHPGFATVSPTGWPEVRTVVLRAVDALGATLDIHTDLRSAKALALQHNPRASRQSYGTNPAPGLPIASALAYDKRPDAASFAVLRCAIAGMDILHLGTGHRRARFDRADGWAGHWLAP